MSRSNPTENAPNPAVRWFAWHGEQGTVRYWDKDAKQNVDNALTSFLLLDELATVRGWHDPSQSGIYANEVRDTRKDLLVVKAFKGGVLAEGLYADIKDRVGNLGGSFVANCYIAFKRDGGELAIGVLQFKGAALGAWMEFRKAHRAELYKKAVQITGFTEGKKGKVVFRVPTFALLDVSKATDEAATALDKELQAWLTAYLARNTHDQATAAPSVTTEIAPEYDDSPVVDDDPIPF